MSKSIDDAKEWKCFRPAESGEALGVRSSILGVRDEGY